MKVQVTVTISSQSKTFATLNMLLASMDTIQNVKQRVATSLSIPFPELEVSYEGKVLQDEQTLGACGVKEGSSLVFHVFATTLALAQQLQDLLKAGALSTAELTLLYSHKYGVSIATALEMVGEKPDLEAFLAVQKFNVSEIGTVSPAKVDVQEEETFDEFELAISINSHLPSMLGVEEEVVIMLSLQDSVGTIIQRVKKAMSLPFEDVTLTLNGRWLQDETRPLASYMGDTDATLGLAYHCSERMLSQQLHTLLKEETIQLSKLSQAYSCRYGINMKHVLRTMGWNEKPEDFVQRLECFVVRNGSLYMPTSQETFVIGSVDQLEALHRSLSKEFVSDSSMLANEHESVKVVAHLLKWWADQQAWSSEQTRPHPELLEAVALHAAHEAVDVVDGLQRAVMYLARLDEARECRDDVDPELVHQRPLVQHPADPSRNMANPAQFDPREIMAFARTAVIAADGAALS
mmetsp:Transcript_12212/g.22557  ORF Transcript_12212/g.22557 Transcript_12212/m.22557 type:complete len:464 (-) Transcript_12212:61-1452(-)